MASGISRYSRCHFWRIKSASGERLIPDVVLDAMQYTSEIYVWENFRQSIPSATCMHQDNMLFSTFFPTSISRRRKRVTRPTCASMRRDIMSFPTSFLSTPFSTSEKPQFLIVNKHYFNLYSHSSLLIERLTHKYMWFT